MCLGSLANADIPYLAFVDQFFELLPGRVGIGRQPFVDHDLPFLVGPFLERNRPVVLCLSILMTAAIL
jgi:hypothetical protein